MRRRQLLGLIGCLLLLVGVFAPAQRGVFGITMSFFQTFPLGALLILLIAAGAGFATYRQRYGLLAVAGAVAVAVIGLVFLVINVQLRTARGLNALMAGTTQMSWGWVALVAGAVSLVAAAVIKEQ